MFMRCKVTIDTSHYPKEVPWELPRGWVWCHLSDLASFAGGKTPSMDNKDFWKNGKHLWITSKDMKSRYLIDSQMKISDTAVREMTVFHPGTILMVNRSGILRRTLPLAILNAEATINQDIKAIVPYLLCISPYLYYAILSQESFILSEYKKAGTTVDNINFDKFISLLIPLPPQKEQDRIVSSINQYFAIIENIDSSQKELNTSLEAAKAKILDLAIRGKLVPQDPNEEPAIELLKRINPNFTPSDNLHYAASVPDGWQLCHIQDIASVELGKTLDRLKNSGEEKPYLCALNVKWDSFDLSTVKTIRIASSEKERYAVKPGDLLVCEGGDVGRSAIWTEHIEMYYQNALHRIRFKSQDICQEFFLYVLRNYKDRGIIDDVCKGVTIKHFTGQVFKSLDLPIPPLKEQKRIVDCVNAYCNILEEIAAGIK